MKKLAFPEVKDSDFEFIKEVSEHYILHSTATFFTEPVTVEDLKEFILTGHPSLYWHVGFYP